MVRIQSPSNTIHRAFPLAAPPPRCACAPAGVPRRAARVELCDQLPNGPLAEDPARTQPTLVMLPSHAPPPLQECLGGGELFDQLLAKGPFGEDYALAIFAQVRTRTSPRVGRPCKEDGPAGLAAPAPPPSGGAGSGTPRCGVDARRPPSHTCFRRVLLFGRFRARWSTSTRWTWCTATSRRRT